MRISDWSSDLCSSDLLAPARDAPVERVEDESQRDQGHADHQVADDAFLQEAHRREDSAGAAEGIGQREPVGELELAQHREMAGALHGRFLFPGIDRLPDYAWSRDAGRQARSCLAL